MYPTWTTLVKARSCETTSQVSSRSDRRDHNTITYTHVYTSRLSLTSPVHVSDESRRWDLARWSTALTKPQTLDLPGTHSTPEHTRRYVLRARTRDSPGDTPTSENNPMYLGATPQWYRTTQHAHRTLNSCSTSQSNFFTQTKITSFTEGHTTELALNTLFYRHSPTENEGLSSQPSVTNSVLKRVKFRIEDLSRKSFHLQIRKFANKHHVRQRRNHSNIQIHHFFYSFWTDKNHACQHKAKLNLRKTSVINT